MVRFYDFSLNSLLFGTACISSPSPSPFPSPFPSNFPSHFPSSPSPSQIASEIDSEQRKELEHMILELEVENANLKEEYNHLKTVGAGQIPLAPGPNHPEVINVNSLLGKKRI
jgi:hypothetical protein